MRECERSWEDCYMRWYFIFVQVFAFCQFPALVYAMQEPCDSSEHQHSSRMRKRGAYAQMPDPSLEKFVAMVDPTAQKLPGVDEQERVHVCGELSCPDVVMDQTFVENNESGSGVKEVLVPVASENRAQVSGQTGLQNSALAELIAPYTLIQKACVSMVHCLCPKPRPTLTVDTSCRDESVVQVTVDASPHEDPASQSEPPSIVSRTDDYCKNFWDLMTLLKGNDAAAAHDSEDVLSEASDDSDLGQNK